MLKLVILDANAVNPGDLDWDAFQRFGRLSVYPRSAQDEVIDRCRKADAVFTNKLSFREPEFAALPNLKYVGVFATGYNLIDTEAASRHGVTVTNIPSYSTESVAQLTWAHLLNLSFRLADHDRSVHRGDWERSPDFCYWNFPLIELRDRILGLVGFGEIGRRVARTAEVFGMKIVACSPSRRPGTAEGAVRFLDFETLLSESDVVSLHCPLKANNARMIDRAALEKMKPDAFFLNMARGGLVDEQALAEALDSGRIAGAGLDVLSEEPPDPGNPLLKARNCFITPHLAWGTIAARKRLQAIAVENYRAFLDGRPQNVVTPGR